MMRLRLSITSKVLACIHSSTELLSSQFYLAFARRRTSRDEALSSRKKDRKRKLKLYFVGDSREPGGGCEKADIRAQYLRIEEDAKAGQIAELEVLAQTLCIRKNEIEDEVREMESYLEKPTIEQQAIAIAGSKLIL